MSTLKVNAIRGTGASSDAISVNSTDGTCTANITNNLSNRNLIINGAMDIAQRGTQTSLSSGSPFGGCDRWKVQPSNLGTWTLGQDTTDAPKDKGFNTCLKLDCTTADASPATGDYLMLQQNIEGYLCNQLAYGQSTAKSVTLSFWCKAEINGWSSGTKSFVAELQAGSTTYESGNLITLTTNDTWQKVSCTFPGMTGQALASTSNGLGITLNLWLDAGTDFTSGTLSTSWSNKSNANRAAGLNLGLGAHTDNNFFMTGVQLEVDNGSSVATDFEHRSYADELRRCQRYYQEIHGGYGGGADDSTEIVYCVTYPVKMRATPSVGQTAAMTFEEPSDADRNQSSTGVSIRGSRCTDTGCVVSLDNYSSIQKDQLYFSSCNQNSGGKVTYSAEL